MNLPLSKTENIIVQKTGREILLYDLSINKAFCLNESLTVIYENCDGRTSFEAFKRKYKFTDDLIYFGLDELKRENLIEGEGADHFAGLTRREIVRRVGLATMIVLPVITSLMAPTAANAATGCRASGQTCIVNANAQSNCCNSNQRCSALTGVCVDCVGKNGSVGTCSGDPSSTCCNDFPFIKNQCCNSGTLTVQNPPFTNIYLCICP